MPGARLFFRSYTAFSTSSTVTGSVEHSRNGSVACEEASKSWSRLTGGWGRKLLICSIHRETQPLSLLVIWPSLSFTRDVFIECPARALRRILKTWEKLLVWAAISGRSAWSFQNFRRSLWMAALRSRFSLRYSARFPEASRSTLINNLQGVTGYPGFLGSVSNWSSRARDRLSDFFREVFPVRLGCICQGVELVRDGAFVGGCDCRIIKPARVKRPWILCWSGEF